MFRQAFGYLGFLGLLALACSSSDANLLGARGTGGGGNAGGTAGNSAGGSGALGTGASTGTGGSTSTGGQAGAVASGGAPGTGAQPGTGGVSILLDGSIPPVGSGSEICDGIDNDNNGIIDDVDVGGDGFCDCLNIATLGRLGLWSTGTSQFVNWLNSRTQKPVTALDDQNLTTVNLNEFQLILVLNVATVQSGKKGPVGQSEPVTHSYSPEEAAALATWVTLSGGGLMTTLGYIDAAPSEEIPNVNRLLAPLDLAYKNDPNGWLLQGDIDITDWLVPHTISDQITAVHVQNGIQPDATRAGTTVVATGAPPGENAKYTVLVTKESGNGRVAMWADEWITYNSDWQATTKWQVARFWANVFKWLTPPKQCQVPIPPNIY